jgi:hypothetical protein
VLTPAPRGKTSAGIAIILGVSERAIIFTTTGHEAARRDS